ncbi:MAG: alpha/beta hydrolase, partial [Thermofilum sp.]
MSVQQERITLPTGLTTVAYKWLPECPVRALVVGVHGFAEHAGRYEHVGRFLVENGFALYMYDLRGHGRSETVRGHVDRFDQFVEDTAAFIEFARREVGAKTFLLGHSMGGLITVLTVSKAGSKLAGFITSGAALELNVSVFTRIVLQLMAALRPLGRVKTPVNAQLLSKDPDIAQRYLSDPLVFKDPTLKLLVEFGKAVSRIWEVAEKISLPALIMHGSEDSI